ncbi:MAG: IS66 family transposase, partial [Pirellulales bacterium]
RTTTTASERSARPLSFAKTPTATAGERGADTQAVLMSIYRTLKQRGHDPLSTITNALHEYLTTGKLRGLPP